MTLLTAISAAGGFTFWIATERPNVARIGVRTFSFFLIVLGDRS